MRECVLYHVFSAQAAAFTPGQDAAKLTLDHCFFTAVVDTVLSGSCINQQVCQTAVASIQWALGAEFQVYFTSRNTSAMRNRCVLQQDCSYCQATMLHHSPPPWQLISPPLFSCQTWLEAKRECKDQVWHAAAALILCFVTAANPTPAMGSLHSPLFASRCPAGLNVQNNMGITL